MQLAFLHYLVDFSQCARQPESCWEYSSEPLCIFGEYVCLWTQLKQANTTHRIIQASFIIHRYLILQERRPCVRLITQF